jgi:site-specific DNA recombinase
MSKAKIKRNGDESSNVTDFSRRSRVAIYARVSTDDQAEAETIQTQVEFLRKYCDLHDLPIADEYLDDGVSGMIPLTKRPQGSRLITDAAKGQFRTVIFYRVSRLGRRLAVVLDAYEALDEVDVVVRSATEPIDTAEPIGRFIFQMLGAFAELDRETILDNTTRGRARGARQGRWYGVVPTGYAVQDGKLIPNESEILPGLAEAELVRDIYRRIAAGESSIKVADYLSALGLRRFKRYAKHDGRESVIEGAPGWPAKRVSELVHNPTYKGTHVYNGKHGDVEREVPALVSGELWDRANAQLAKNRVTASRNSKQTYLLRSLIRCGACGVAYIGMSSQGARSYRCGYASPGHRGTPGDRCRGKVLNADHIEAAVWEDCERFLRDPGEALNEAKRQLEASRRAAPDPEPVRQALLRQLASKDGERGDVVTLMRRRVITVDEAEQQLTAIAGEQDAIQAELVRLAAQQAVYDSSAQQIETAEALLAAEKARRRSR